jgi:hypothetical protein
MAAFGVSAAKVDVQLVEAQGRDMTVAFEEVG